MTFTVFLSRLARRLVRPLSTTKVKMAGVGGAVPATAGAAAVIDGATTLNYISAFRLTSKDNQSSAVLGFEDNFWLWSVEAGFDLTHPPTPSSDPVEPRLTLQCALTPITVDPAKTALLIIDMQNYNLAKELGNHVKAYHDAEDNILKYAIPAARKTRIQIIWLTWGLTEADLEQMDPGVLRTFGWHSVRLDQPPPAPRPGEGARKDGERMNDKGLGEEIGEVTLENGTTVEGGRILMQGTWNAELHGPLAQAFTAGQTASRQDVRFHKNRNSGMCDKMTALTEYLEREQIKTLLFTGANTDQCVMGTLQDANLKGYDCVLLKDGCGTNSPEFAQLSAEYNCLRSWGFLSTCKDLATAAGVEVKNSSK
ncbi:isochorismatase family protein [Lasiosphaeria ovina]|uniref:Isochorismatase family protein n=1 Tax=Lasiosphaeria ovina TaxID=92902 RepID=A0AAE0KMX9_9PEZI|nr:isochorismatase family protein [Lasiosphaeria ovina]